MRWVTRLRAAVAVSILLGLSACVDAQTVPVAPTGQSAPSGGQSGSTAHQESVPAAVAATAQPSQLDATAYLNSLQERVASHLRYPDLLRRHNVTGTVEFVVTLLRNGHIAAITLFRSSGKPEIDLIAEEAIRNSIPLPPPPPSVPGDKVRLHAMVTVDPDDPGQDRTVGSNSGAVRILPEFAACVDAQPVPVAPTGQSAPSGGESGSTTQQESVPAAVAATAQSSQQNAVAYLNTVRDRMKSHLRYPELLRRKHVTGTVEFGIAILRDGRVICLELQRSSGIAEVDLVAEKAIRDSSPLPPPPTDLPGEKVTLRAVVEVKP